METLTRWQDPTIDDLIKENLELKRKLGEADDAVEYWKLECDKRSKVLDKIKDIITSKDICIDTRKTDGSMDYVDLKQIILKLLEEIE